MRKISIILAFISAAPVAVAKPIYFTFQPIDVVNTVGHQTLTSYGDLKYIFKVDTTLDGLFTDIDGRVTRYTDMIAAPSYRDQLITNDYFYTDLVRGHHLNGQEAKRRSPSINVGGESIVLTTSGTMVYHDYQMSGGDDRGLNFAIRHDWDGSVNELLQIGGTWQVHETFWNDGIYANTELNARLVSISETNPIDAPTPAALLGIAGLALAAARRYRCNASVVA